MKTTGFNMHSLSMQDCYKLNFFVGSQGLGGLAGEAAERRTISHGGGAATAWPPLFAAAFVQSTRSFALLYTDVDVALAGPVAAWQSGTGTSASLQQLALSAPSATVSACGAALQAL